MKKYIVSSVYTATKNHIIDWIEAENLEELNSATGHQTLQARPMLKPQVPMTQSAPTNTLDTGVRCP